MKVSQDFLVGLSHVEPQQIVVAQLHWLDLVERELPVTPGGVIQKGSRAR